MSENRDRGIRDFSQYDTMSTEELEEILRFDTDAPEGDEPDVDLILYVLEVLADRRRNNNEITGNEALEAFESFKQDYLPEGISIDSVPEEKNPAIRPGRWLRGLTAAAAVLAFVLLGSVTANAFGVNIWKTVAVWAQETFRLEGNEKAESELPEKDNQLQYSSLNEVLRKDKVETDLVPTWVPTDYKLVDIIIDENPLRKKYIAVYDNGETKLRIVVQAYLNGYPEQIEQDDETEETYLKDGIAYYIFEDISTLQAVWIKDSYECYISGALSVEQMKMMIDSISKG